MFYFEHFKRDSEVTIKSDSSASHILKDFTLKDLELKNF